MEIANPFTIHQTVTPRPPISESTHQNSLTSKFVPVVWSLNMWQETVSANSTAQRLCMKKSIFVGLRHGRILIPRNAFPGREMGETRNLINAVLEFVCCSKYIWTNLNKTCGGLGIQISDSRSVDTITSKSRFGIPKRAASNALMQSLIIRKLIHKSSAY